MYTLWYRHTLLTPHTSHFPPPTHAHTHLHTLTPSQPPQASVIDSTTTSPITSYTIRYQEKGGGGGGGGGGSDGERQVVPPSTSVVLGADGGPPLMKGTDYIVTVVVSNQEGPGLGTSASVETDVDREIYTLSLDL